MTELVSTPQVLRRGAGRDAHGGRSTTRSPPRRSRPTGARRLPAGLDGGRAATRSCCATAQPGPRRCSTRRTDGLAPAPPHHLRRRALGGLRQARERAVHRRAGGGRHGGAHRRSPAARPQPEPGPAGAQPRRALRWPSGPRSLKGSEILLLDRTSGDLGDHLGRRERRGRRRSPGRSRPSPPSRGTAGSSPSRPSPPAAQLVVTPKPSNDYRQVFLRDRQDGTTTLLSIGPAGTQGLGHSLTPAISGNGAVVAFASAADDLVADDANEQDRRLRVVELDRGRGDRLALDGGRCGERRERLSRGQRRRDGRWPSRRPPRRSSRATRPAGLRLHARDQ